MRWAMAIALGLGIGFAFSPVLVSVPPHARLIGMAFAVGTLGALMLWDVWTKRRR